MSSGVLITTADTPSSCMSQTQSLRPDSPGGYFTLSDSDGASGTGQEPQSESETNATTMYKLLRSPASKSLSESPPPTIVSSSLSQRCRSETPPRNEVIRKKQVSKLAPQDVAPPRPPPPTTYTSTLPPPVPKKKGKQQSSERRPTSSGSVNLSRKTHQKIQIQMSSTNGPSTDSSRRSSSENSPEPRLTSLSIKKKSPPPNTNEKPNNNVTFLRTFQRATCSSTDSLSSITSAMSSSPSKPKQIFNKKPFIVTTRRTLSEDRSLPKNPINRPNIYTSSSQKKVTSTDVKISTAEEKKPQNRYHQIHRTFANGFGQIDNATPSNKSNSSVKSAKTISPASRRSSSDSNKIQQIPKKSLTETFTSSEKIQKLKQTVSLNKAKSATKGIEKTMGNVQTRLKNSITSLVRPQESPKKAKQPVALRDTSTPSSNCFKVHDDNQSICTATSGHLSQLSQFSSDRLQTWLANPLPSLESKDFSMLEVDILDQYITDMLSFTRGALSSMETQQQSPGAHIKSKESSNLDFDLNENKKVPLKQLTQKLVEPTEEDLQLGVFTEVSFAGTFASPLERPPSALPRHNKSKPKDELNKSSNASSVAPIPSPRLKRKARKEKMLKEHKEAGKEAISLLVKKVQPKSEENVDVNVLLNDLCTHSIDVERNIYEDRRLSKAQSQEVQKPQTINNSIECKESDDFLDGNLSDEQNDQSYLEKENEQLRIKILDLSATVAEHSTSTSLAMEQLDEERFQRRLERRDLEEKISCLKRMLENVKNENADVDNPDAGLTFYKLKCERIIKEQEQIRKDQEEKHEDAIIFLKKQFGKKLNDSCEESNSHRQVLGEWKRKAQSVQAEMQEIKSQLEEQFSKSSVLEKRLKKFEADHSSVQVDYKKKVSECEKLHNEICLLKVKKSQLEDELQVKNIDLDLKDSVIQKLSGEIKDLRTDISTDDELSLIKRQKYELEMKLCQEVSENEDLSVQIQTLEQTCLKLEASIGDLKATHRREMSSKDDELEDTRQALLKKLKGFENQLEDAHEERLSFIREKRELESKIITLQDLVTKSTDEEQVTKLKRDFKRTKALLKDAQLMLSKSTQESSNKVFIKQLKNQLEDAELARNSALKAKQNLEMELSDVQGTLDDVLRTKSEIDDRVIQICREKADLSSQLEDAEEELQEVMKKYKSTVAQLSADHATIQEQARKLTDLDEEKAKLKDQNSELNRRIESLEGDSLANHNCSRLEFKVKEMEVKLDLEKTTKGRLEAQILRLKEAVERVTKESDFLRCKESSSQDEIRKLHRQLRDLREDFTTTRQKEADMKDRKIELEKKLEVAKAENISVQSDLKSALKRIDDLQAVISGQLDSDLESLRSDDVESFLETNQELLSGESRDGSAPRFVNSILLLDESNL